MKIALTGATGFLGRHVARQLAAEGHSLRCLARAGSRRDDLPDGIEWCEGDLAAPEGFPDLLGGCDAVVHAALYHPSGRFREEDCDLREYLQINLMGSLALVEAARQAECGRFVFVSTCAVHEKILGDRPLDEAHPLWPTSHYGAYKAAVEAFVHSYGKGHGYPICAVRPSGIYGITEPVENSRWYDLVAAIARGETVTCMRGGKEVHVVDVARAISLLLTAENVAGEVYNCCDRYVSEYEVATLARRLTRRNTKIEGRPSSPKNQIATDKLRALGFKFGGTRLLEETIKQLIRAAGG